MHAMRIAVYLLYIQIVTDIVEGQTYDKTDILTLKLTFKSANAILHA